jgi:hypothetical protein
MNKGCALITGASMGLGRAFARECAARGKDLILVALPGSGLQAVAESIEAEHGVRALALELDLTERRGIELVGEAMRAEGPALDLVVNNAGLGEPGTFLDLPSEYHDDVISLNATALVRLCRLAIEAFEGRSGCSILNVASLGSLFPMPGMAVYSATKSFVRSFTQALRAELAGKVAISALCPNAFATTPESAAYIARCGLASKLCCLSVERIAKAGLDGLARGKAMIYPGGINALLALLSRFAPPSLAALAVRRYWGGFAKKSPTLWSRREAWEGASKGLRSGIDFSKQPGAAI